jgi:hypothetical protein
VRFVTLRDEKVAGLFSKKVIRGHGVKADPARARFGHLCAFACQRVTAPAGAGLVDGNLPERFPLAAVDGHAGRRAVLRKNGLTERDDSEQETRNYWQPQ